ncbi:MAG: SRPBCC family protein [bacterium]
MRVLRYILGAVAALAVIFVLIGMFVPSFTYENRIEVSKPVEHSFAVFSDPANMSEWLTGFKSMENLTGGPNEVGSTWKLVFVDGDEEIIMTEEVTGFKENELISFTLDNEVLEADIEVHFVRKNGTTGILQSSKVEGKNLFWKSLLFLSKWNMTARGQENYVKLKHLIETTELQTANDQL